MTPTREQVIAAFSAEFEPMGYEMELARCCCCTFANERTQDAFMGFTAGRDQGLREAKEVCEALDAMAGNDYATYSEGYADAATTCAAAIEQMRGK